MQNFSNDNKKQQQEIVQEKLQQFKFEKQKKRQRALETWKWNEVVDLLSSEDQVLDVEAVETTDTADSTALTTSTRPIKRPRVTIHKQNRFHQLHDEEDSENHVVMG